MATNLVAEVTAALEKYSQEAQYALDEAAKEAAELTQRQLKATSPRGKGKYSRGWSVRKQESGGLVSYVVYNRAQPGLTHTLEHGHLARNQYGTFGRVRAILTSARRLRLASRGSSCLPGRGSGGSRHEHNGRAAEHRAALRIFTF